MSLKISGQSFLFDPSKVVFLSKFEIKTLTIQTPPPRVRSYNLTIVGFSFETNSGKSRHLISGKVIIDRRSYHGISLSVYT